MYSRKRSHVINYSAICTNNLRYAVYARGLIFQSAYDIPAVEILLDIEATNNREYWLGSPQDMDGIMREVQLRKIDHLFSM